MFKINQHNEKWFKAALFVLCLLPLVWIVYLAFNHRLGANPIEKLEHLTGGWAMRFLLLTLAISPLRKLSGWNALARFRRMLGLTAFFYACIHFSMWLVFDHFFEVADILKDIRKRPYVTVGFTAFVLLIPLAVTSTNAMVKRLGGKNWTRLHTLIYPIGTLVILHFLWLVKADKREPILYALIFITLLLLRSPTFFKRKPAATTAPRTTAAVTLAADPVR